MKTISYKREQQNPFYDIRFCFNGGGYSQPKITCVVEDDNGKEHTIIVNNTSCGDFGVRYTVSVDGEIVISVDHVGNDEEWTKATDEQLALIACADLSHYCL